MCLTMSHRGPVSRDGANRGHAGPERRRRTREREDAHTPSPLACREHVPEGHHAATEVSGGKGAPTYKSNKD